MTAQQGSGSDLEHEFAFGVVRQLLERVADDRLEGAAPAVGAESSFPSSPGAGGAVAAGWAGAADARFAVLHALYWLVANLAAERPLLLAVDDAQWADEPSLRFLAYLARRVRELPVAVIVAARPSLPGDDRAALEAIAAGADTPAPAPLSASAIAVLAARRFGGEPEPAFVEACLHPTGGNALLVQEVLNELEAADAQAVETAGGERVGRRVGRRLAALGGGAGPLAAAVSVIGDGCEFTVTAALAGLTLEQARGAAAELAAADLLEDAGTLRFRHPLIRAAVSELQPAVDLGLAHGRAARLLADRGAPSGAVASHLLAAPPPGGAAWGRGRRSRAGRSRAGRPPTPLPARAGPRRACRRRARRPGPSRGGLARLPRSRSSSSRCSPSRSAGARRSRSPVRFSEINGSCLTIRRSATSICI